MSIHSNGIACHASFRFSAERPDVARIPLEYVIWIALQNWSGYGMMHKVVALSWVSYEAVSEEMWARPEGGRVQVIRKSVTAAGISQHGRTGRTEYHRRTHFNFYCRYLTMFVPLMPDVLLSRAPMPYTSPGGFGGLGSCTFRACALVAQMVSGKLHHRYSSSIDVVWCPAVCHPALQPAAPICITVQQHENIN